VTGAASAHNELPDAPRGIRGTAGVLRRESLVIVIVSVHYDVRIRRVEGIPEGLHPPYDVAVVAVLARAKERVVEVG
jgi:hypothetical protein